MATIKAHGGEKASITIQLGDDKRTRFVVCQDGAVLRALIFHETLFDGSTRWYNDGLKLYKPAGSCTTVSLITWRDRTLGKFRNARVVAENGLHTFEVVR